MLLNLHVVKPGYGAHRSFLSEWMLSRRLHESGLAHKPLWSNYVVALFCREIVRDAIEFVPVEHADNSDPVRHRPIWQVFSTHHASEQSLYSSAEHKRLVQILPKRQRKLLLPWVDIEPAQLFCGGEAGGLEATIGKRNTREKDVRAEETGVPQDF